MIGLTNRCAGIGLALLCWVDPIVPMAVLAKAMPGQRPPTVAVAQSPSPQGDSLFLDGLRAYQNQQMEAAIAAWQEALDLYRVAMANHHQSVALNYLAAAYLGLGQTNEAKQSLLLALPLAQQAEDIPLQAQILANFGIVYRTQGRYITALETYDRALHLMRQLGDPKGEAQILGLLGNVHNSLGEYQQAKQWHQQSLEIAQHHNFKVIESTALVNLGAVESRLGNYDQAINYYQQSQQLSAAQDDLVGIALALNNLGSAYQAQGKLDQALQHYQESLETAQTLKNRRLEGEIFGSLGLIFKSMNRPDQALSYLEQSLAIAQDIEDPNAVAIALNNLGHMLYTMGHLDAASTKLYAAINILESLRPETLDDRYAVSIFDTQVLTYNLLQQILIGQGNIEAALEIAERGRARAFVSLLATHNKNQTVATAPAPTIDQIKAIAKEQQATLVEYTLVPDDSFKFQGKQRGTAERLYIWVVQPTGQVDFRDVDLKPLQQEKGTSIAKLVETTRDRSGIRGSSRVRPGDQVRREGDPLDWAPYDVTAIDPRAGTVTLSHPDFMLPTPVVPLSEVYRVSPSGFATVLRQQSQWQELHQLLIEPIADLLPKDPEDRVVFIPQEQLFLVPFPALQGEDGSYLIEHHTILSAPAIQILGLTNHSGGEIQQPDGLPLVVGNPSPMPENLQPLPHAGTEASTIATVLSTPALIGNSATEIAIKQQLSRASLIHLATHGFFNESNPLQGSLAFVPTDGEDGFLTAEEILAQSLTAKLVVLSACDTGRGQITGDGVIGLSRSFLAAGANNVMVSLWQVPDDATAQLMVEFYRQRQELDDAQALRQAMLATREQYEDPVAWAAFTLMGAME